MYTSYSCSLGPFEKKVFVLFQKGKGDSFSVHLSKKKPRSPGKLTKIPAGFRVLVTVEKFPNGSPPTSKISFSNWEMLDADTVPVPAGYCAGTADECPGIYSPCKPGQFLVMDGDKCECRDGQGGG